MPFSHEDVSKYLIVWHPAGNIVFIFPNLIQMVFFTYIDTVHIQKEFKCYKIFLMKISLIYDLICAFMVFYYSDLSLNKINALQTIQQKVNLSSDYIPVSNQHIKGTFYRRKSGDIENYIQTNNFFLIYEYIIIKNKLKIFIILYSK